MSLKPEVVRVKGVHSETNSNQKGDIGFPQLQLEKLFEAATVRELAQGDQYNPKKKYTYRNPDWLSIENRAHFDCVRYGYQSLDGSVDHYYTKEGDGYKYNAVPPTESWEGKFALSEAIKNKELYSISREEERIYIEGQGYYKKENDSYKRQSQINYTTFEAKGFDWNGSKYECKRSIARDPETGEIIRDENGVIVTISTWQDSNQELATSGNYIYVHKVPTTDSITMYQVKLLYIEFNDGIWETDSASLYKFSEGFSTANIYVKNGQKIVKLSDNEITLDNDPATGSSIYYPIGEWSYPNTVDPSNVESIALLSETNGIWRSFNQADFSLYTGAALSGISKVPNARHTVYEKLAITVNYKYSGNNNLKFIFTNKSVDDVLAACNLKSTLPSKYVHLTNLEYTTDMA